jgi:hypothetical protein
MLISAIFYYGGRQGAIPVWSNGGQTYLNPGESAESTFKETESRLGRIMKIKQTRVFGFAEFLAL